jgi:ankyrin repeat protein
VLDKIGHTALHHTGAMARLQLVHALLAGGADVHSENYGGETPWSALPLPVYQIQDVISGMQPLS